MKELGLDFIKQLVANIVRGCSEEDFNKGFDVQMDFISIINGFKKYKVDWSHIEEDYEDKYNEVLENAFSDIDIYNANKIIDSNLHIGRIDTENEFNKTFAEWNQFDVYQLSENHNIDPYDDYAVVDDYNATAESFSDLGDYLKENYKKETIDYLGLKIHENTIESIIEEVDNYIIVEDVKEGE